MTQHNKIKWSAVRGVRQSNQHRSEIIHAAGVSLQHCQNQNTLHAPKKPLQTSAQTCACEIRSLSPFPDLQTIHNAFSHGSQDGMTE